MNTAPPLFHEGRTPHHSTRMIHPPTPTDRSADPHTPRASDSKLSGRCVAVLLGALVATTGQADDVHLTNGAVFEDVSTEVTETHVVIEMPIGRLRLPNEQVARIVEGDSPIATFQRRSNELLSDPSSGAADFLELARWSIRQGLNGQARQAALIAARFAPELDGLSELLSGLGYEHVDGIGWLPYAEAQRSRGLVLFDGEWLTRREREQRIARDHREETRRARAPGAEPSDRELARDSIELARRTVEAVDRAAQQSSERAVEADRRAVRAGFQTHGPRFGARQNNVYGGVVLPVRGVDPEAAAAYQERLSRDLKSLATRAPGSLIPVQQHRPPD